MKEKKIIAYLPAHLSNCGSGYNKTNYFFKGWPYFAMFFITFMLLIQIHYILGHTKKMPRFSGQFCKKWMREGGFFILFFSEVFFLFSKDYIKSTTAAIVTLSRMICFISFQSKNLYSILFYYIIYGVIQFSERT